MKKYAFLLVCLGMLAATACGRANSSKVEHEGMGTITYKTPKYVFLFIGDGMSTPQINMTEAAFREAAYRDAFTSQTGVKDVPEKLNFRQFPVVGMATTHAANRFITCSAAAATALATGHKTSIGTVSMSADHTERLTTIAEMAKAKGMKVGIISSVSIDHATPACFYAHTEDRGHYDEIGRQLTASGFDYFAGGSVLHYYYGENYSLEAFRKESETAGYSFVDTREAFDALTPESGKVIATIALRERDYSDGMSLPYNIDLDLYEGANDRITLADFTQKGIELMDNPNGFFMMVEGGKIDWCGHANDVVSGSYEVKALDMAIGRALDFYRAHPDETLIVVTGDHETGGLTLGFAGTNYDSAFAKLTPQNISFERFSATVVSEWRHKKNVTFPEAMKAITRYFGLGDAEKGMQLSDYETRRLKEAFRLSMGAKPAISREEMRLAYGGYDPLTVTITHIIANKAGVDWTSYSHTALPVPVFAIGQGQQLFSGYIDNTDIPNHIKEIAEL